MDAVKLAERLVAYLEKKGGNITESYHDWLIACFSCCSLDAYGGKQLFHRISKLSSKYKASECDKQYEACLRTTHESTPNIAPLLALSAQHGYFIKDDFTPRSTPQITRPLYYSQLPQQQPSFNLGDNCKHSFILKTVLSLVSDPNIKAPALLSYISGCATLLEKVTIYYQGQQQHLHLYYCLVAPPASGKSELGKVAKIFGAVQEDLMTHTNALREQYLQDRKNAKAADREEIAKPPLHTLFLPADTSTAALMKTLQDNNGNGLIWETELDTLTRNMKSEYGNYSDLLRNNWQSETIKSNRKKDREFITLDDPHFSLICSGTPQQIPRFFGSAENGLFSRFLFGSLPPSLEWRDQFSVSSSGRDIHDLALMMRDFKAFYTNGANITFTDKQKKEHFSVWSEATRDYYNIGGDELVGCVRRHGLAQLRIASILTCIEAWEKRRVGSLAEAQFNCTAKAWELSILLARLSLSSTMSAYTLLSDAPKDTATKKSRERDELFLSLPPLFTLDTLPSQLSKSTKYRLVELWRQQGLVEKTKDGYTKIAVGAPSVPIGEPSSIPTA